MLLGQNVEEVSIWDCEILISEYHVENWFCEEFIVIVLVKYPSIEILGI